jgi:cold shock protein
MPSGTVKWFNATKGYGFIQPDGGTKDVFVHISAVERAGLSDLREGAKVTYDVVPNKGKESAENLRVRDGERRFAPAAFTRPRFSFRLPPMCLRCENEKPGVGPRADRKYALT